MATSRVALKSRKLLVAVPATMLLPPRPSIDRLADRQPAHVDPVVAVAADHDVMAIAAIEQVVAVGGTRDRSEEHTSELQSLMRISYAVFCLKKKTTKKKKKYTNVHANDDTL